MIWLIWVTFAFFFITLVVIFYMASSPKLESKELPSVEWPPVFSEIIERRKNMIVLFFVFSAGMMFLNMMIIGIILNDDAVMGLTIIIFFATLGIIAFDVSRKREMHYFFVFIVLISISILGNILPMDSVCKLLLNFFTILFVICSFIVLFVFRFNTYTQINTLEPTAPQAASYPPLKIPLSQSVDVPTARLITAAQADPVFTHPIRTIYSSLETLWLLGITFYYFWTIWYYRNKYEQLLSCAATIK